MVFDVPFADLRAIAKAADGFVSRSEMCCIAVNLDPSAVTEPERFVRDLSGSNVGTGPPIRRV
jgi:hypothetical protein